jgi:hypothetical protein
MARGKAAAAADDARAVKAGAVQRVLARRRPPRYAEGPDGRGGTFRWQLADSSDFTPPRTVSEWADDRLARCTPGTPLTDLLIAMYGRIREGGAAAVPAVVAMAAGLNDSAQWGLWLAIAAAPSGPDGIGANLKAEWKRRGMRTKPAPLMQMEPTNRDAPSEAARLVRYRTELGNPAGPAYTAA